IFKVGEKIILFDSGLDMGNWRKLFFSALKDINLTINDIDYCFISHEHPDHVGLARILKQKNPNLKILMHDIAAKILEWETKEENLDEVEREASKIANQMIKYGMNEKQAEEVVDFFNYLPKSSEYQKPDMILHDGDIILENLEIIWTPGHSFGHMCVFNRKKKHLFCGDHILSRITPHIGNFIVPPFLTKQYKDYDFNNILKYYLNSLDRIDKLNSKIIFPAHQDIIYNPHKRIAEIKDHHKIRLAEILKVIKNNPLTPLRISQLHFGNSLDEMDSFLALSEVLGHLFYLKEQALVYTLERNGQILYYS
ncbi:MAG: MBL fold metallo-hydrolase, partial [Promethearchaeota archaeon]